MNALNKALHLVKKLMQICCALLMVLMTVVTFMQVINRNLVGRSFYWAEELVLFAMVWITFLGSALAVSRDSHTRIDFFVNLFPDKAKIGFDIAGNLVCCAFVGILMRYSIPLIRLNANNLSSNLKWPMSITYIGIIVSGALMILFFLLGCGKQVWDAARKEADNQ